MHKITITVDDVVALRKESVDRNTSFSPVGLFDLLSLSARRAWIEMLASRLVDMSAAWSLSARRAWIEIMLFLSFRLVAGCRSPQGERG